MDAVFDIAKNTVNLRYEDIPPEIVDLTKKSVLDTLGVIAGASTMGQGCQEIVNLIKGSGAKGKSTIIGYGGRVPSWMAGFANGSMVHQLDYDDVGGAGHPAACTVPTAFAVAEEVGGINGKELIVAVASAVDLNCRIGLAINQEFLQTGWFLPPLIGYFTATAVAGRILGLSEDGMVNAFGHVYQQAAGNHQVSYSPGSVFRGIRDGFSIKAGILSALMAKMGLPGTKDTLEGKAGLFDLYFNGAYDRSYLTGELGKKFYNTELVGFKRWPSCGRTHGAIDATVDIVSEHNIQPDDIDEIRVLAGGSMGHQAEASDSRRRPQTVIDAKFSMHFTLGVAANRKKVLIKDFTLDGLKDPAVLDMAQKVSMKVDPGLKDNPNSTIVEIKTKNGQQYSKRVDIPYGRAGGKPIAKEDLVTKFRDCVSFSAKPLSKSKADKVIGLVDNLEEVKDVSRIIRMLG